MVVASTGAFVIDDVDRFGAALGGCRNASRAPRDGTGSGAGTARTVRTGTGLNRAVSTGASRTGADVSVAHTEPDAIAANITPARMRRAIATHGDVRRAEQVGSIGVNCMYLHGWANQRRASDAPAARSPPLEKPLGESPHLLHDAVTQLTLSPPVEFDRPGLRHVTLEHRFELLAEVAPDHDGVDLAVG